MRLISKKVMVLMTGMTVMRMMTQENEVMLFLSFALS